MLEFSLVVFVASFLLITLAEMGDKTQLLAMSLATRYNPNKVLFAIFLATIASFGITVAVAQLLTSIIPLYVISLAASLAFIGFGLWTLRQEQPKSEAKKVSHLGAIGTVGVTFFIAEFGDKTQLAAVSLAAEYQNALSVLLGATLGMLLADGLAIIVGVVLSKHIPQKIIKWVSAAIFLVFGLVGVYEVLAAKIGLAYTSLALSLLIVLVALTTRVLTVKSFQKVKKFQISNNS